MEHEKQSHKSSLRLIIYEERDNDYRRKLLIAVHVKPKEEKQEGK